MHETGVVYELIFLLVLENAKYVNLTSLSRKTSLKMRASYQIWLVSRHGEAPLPARVLQLLLLHPREVGDRHRWGSHHAAIWYASTLDGG